MLAAVLSGFVLSLAAPSIHKLGRSLTGWIIAVLPAGLFLYFATFVRPIAEGKVFSASYDWASGLGINLSFYLDGLSLLFALLISGIGALIMVYAGGYLAGHRYLGRFYLFILMFMASMLGVALADNLVTLFVFWELTSLSSYLLIGFDHEDRESRDAALQALVVTSGGGLALLAGLLLLGHIGGSFELSTLFDRGDVVRSHALYLPTLLLVLIGAFTKSAQFPFHFWLPSAMQAPTPVSAYLHSATMVKAGVYLMARAMPILGDTDAWRYIVTIVGAVTMLVGGYLALTKTDLKQILAYSTISALGVLTLLLGLETSGAVEAAMVFLLAHALYKGALFMVAGAVDHETGTRDVERLGGLRRAMPITAVVAVMAALSLAGFGPLLSFIGKEMFFEAALQASQAPIALAVAAVLAGAMFVTAAAIVSIRPFFGNIAATPKNPHEAPASLWLGPALLAGAGIIFGVAPALIAATIISPSAAAILNKPAEVNLSLWHGLNPSLAMSVASVLAGLFVYSQWRTIRRAASRVEKFSRCSPSALYDLLLDAVKALARAQTRVLQNGYLRSYILIIITTTTGLVCYTLLSRAELYGIVGWSDVRFYEAALAGMILLAALASVRSRSRLGAVAALGVVGYCGALIFIFFGAPDLAMTQFMIETLTVILFVLVFYHLPRYVVFSKVRSRVRDMIVAGLAGAMMTALVLVASNVHFYPPISDYYAENSQPRAHGRNIVNVILVDFRGIDTLGEITVLAVAAVGVFALLKLRLAKKEK